MHIDKPKKKQRQTVNWGETGQGGAPKIATYLENLQREVSRRHTDHNSNAPQLTPFEGKVAAVTPNSFQTSELLTVLDRLARGMGQGEKCLLIAQRSHDSSLFWCLSGGLNSQPMSGQQSYSLSSAKNSRLTCSDFISTLHGMTPSQPSVLWGLEKLFICVSVMKLCSCMNVCDWELSTYCSDSDDIVTPTATIQLCTWQGKHTYTLACAASRWVAVSFLF